MPLYKLLMFYDDRLRRAPMSFAGEYWAISYVLSMLAALGVVVVGIWVKTPILTAAGCVSGLGAWSWFFSEARKSRRLASGHVRFEGIAHEDACTQDQQARLLNEWLESEKLLTIEAVKAVGLRVDWELSEHRRRRRAPWSHLPAFLGLFLSGVFGAIYARVPEAEFGKAVADIAALLIEVAGLVAITVSTADLFDIRGYKLVALRGMLSDVELELHRGAPGSGA